MIYDYIITQFYPNKSLLILLFLFVSLSTLSFCFVGSEKSKKVVRVCSITSLVLFIIIALLPDVEYVKHYYGEARQLTEEQKQQIQMQYEKQYNNDLSLFIQCLGKGMKQPTHTTFNDTNEVVKSCHNIAKYKFD